MCGAQRKFGRVELKVQLPQPQEASVCAAPLSVEHLWLTQGSQASSGSGPLSTSRLSSRDWRRFRRRRKEENNNNGTNQCICLGPASPRRCQSRPTNAEPGLENNLNRIATTRLDRSFGVIPPLNGQVQTLEDSFTSLQCGSSSRHHQSFP